MTTERLIDPLDIAAAAEEKFREAALAVRMPQGPQSCGHCLNCDAPLAAGLRWCDAACRDEWEALDTYERKQIEQQRAEEIERAK